MKLPSPSHSQAKMFWAAVTILAASVAIIFFTLLILGMAWLAERLATILLPLAVAAIISYLLDPVVDFFEKRDFERLQAIFIVYLMAFLTFTAIAVPVVPKLIGDATEVASSFIEQARSQAAVQTPEGQEIPNEDIPKNLEENVRALVDKVGKWFNKFLPEEVRGLWKEYEEKIGEQMINVGKTLSLWIFNTTVSAMKGIGAWTGYLIGFAMVPVFVFFFLLEKWRIVRTWTDYLPVSDPEWKKEIIFVLTSINDSLIVFFRGQVLVAICIGTLLALGFSLIGLKYGVLLGVAAGVLSIIPYLGFVLGIVPAVLLAIAEHGDLLHPLLTVAVFLAVQFAEGMFISPKIMGDRVGLHPLTIILAVLIGTTLMGGLLGAVLAIPLTAAGRAILVRYVWKRIPGEDFDDNLNAPDDGDNSETAEDPA